MVISWVLAQFNAYLTALRSDCWWCRYASPKVKETLWEELIELGRNFLSVWTTGYMAYDDHQWALLPLLLASMLVYILLSATMFVKFRWRLAIYFILAMYFHQDTAKDVGESTIHSLVMRYGNSDVCRNISTPGNLWHVSQ